MKLSIISLACLLGTSLHLEAQRPGQRLDAPVRENAIRSDGEAIISSNGIVWYLSGVEANGQFINGDHWVVPKQRIVQLDRITPPTLLLGERIMNGSMINPNPAQRQGQYPGSAQGYDSSMYGAYQGPGDFSLGLCATSVMPLPLIPGQSLVSTISVSQPGARPQIERAAVLTVLEKRPPAKAFRPPYVSGEKPIVTIDDVDFSKLRILKPSSKTPDFDRVASWFMGVRLNHTPQNLQRYLHPLEIMPDYGREISEQTGTAALMLLLDVPDEEKEQLMIGYLQLGLDLYGVALNVRKAVTADGATGLEARRKTKYQTWPGYGGHHQGNKWPILFAGMVLEKPAMIEITKDYSPVAFAEDDQTFYVDTIRPEQGYEASYLGLAEWGQRHFIDPSLDNARWVPLPKEQARELTGLAKQRNQAVLYRRCCTSNSMFGQALAAMSLPGAREAWGHEAFFDYMQRYAEIERGYSRGATLCAGTFTDQWPLEMWYQETSQD